MSHKTEQQLSDMTVESIMSRQVVCARPNDTIHEAIQLMFENRISALPVVDQRDRCIGMLSTTDLMEHAQYVDDEISHLSELGPISQMMRIDELESGQQGTVQEYMCDTVASIGPQATIVAAARELIRNRVHRLPVVDGKGTLVGIISTMDIVGAIANQPF